MAPDLYRGGGCLMYWTHKPIAPWHTPAWLDQMRQQLRPNQFLRMIENRFVTTESNFVDMAWWDHCVDGNLRPVIADHHMSCWGGVDASVKRDSTAIVLVTWDEEAKRARLVWHRIFQPSAKDPLDFEAAIEATLLDLHARFELREVRFDPYQMQASAQRLQRAGVPMLEFPQSVPNLTEASTNLYELIKGRGLAVYPDADMRLSVSRAVALETSRGWKIAKEKVSHKIDVVVALAQAALGAALDQQLEPPIIAFYRHQVLRRDDPEHHPEPPNEMMAEYERTMKEIAEAEDAARGVIHIENVSSGSTPAGSVAPSMNALAPRILGR